MKQKVGIPVIVIAALAVVALCVFLGKQFMGPAPTNTGPHTFPSFIDPATGKPKAGAMGSSGATGASPSNGSGMMSGGSGGR